jgi:transglutaminase-like putative cysteine protease
MEHLMLRATVRIAVVCVLQWGQVLASLHEAQAVESGPGAPAAAQSEYYGSTTITVEPDGRFVTETELVERLLDATARDDVAQKTFYFNDQNSTMDVLEAETMKADGRRIQVRPDQIRLQEDPATAGVPMFTTSKMKTIIFPNVDVGDSVRYRVRRTQTTPDFPGQFTFTNWFFPDELVRSYKITLKAPRSLGLRRKIAGLQETHQIENGGDIWTWSFSQPQPRAVDDEDGKVDKLVNEPHVIVSSFESWKAVAGAYLERAKDKASVTSEIQSLADHLSVGTTDRREQARRIYDWVRSNIRYVALYLSDGGFVPHPAGDILRNRYGDCKDHVVLLEALLRAKGIESHGVLIPSGTTFTVTLPEPDVFDHIITYVPELDLYLDATNQYLPFGERGYWLSAKPVLHLQGKNDIVRTPPMPAAANMRKSSLRMTLGLDGSLKGRLEETSSGTIALHQRGLIASIDPLLRKEAVAKALQLNGWQGHGSYSADDPVIGSKDYHLAVDFQADQTDLDLSQLEAIEVRSPIEFGYEIADATGFATKPPEPQFSSTCKAIDLSEDYTLLLPKGIGIQSLPRSLSLADGPIRYDSAFEQQGQEVRIHRRYTMTNDRGYCTPQEMASMAQTAKVIRQNLAAKILVAPVANGSGSK